MRQAITRSILFMTGTLLCAVSGLTVADSSSGKVVFERLCAPCHGAGPGLDGSKTLPGTAAIEAKYKGEIPPLLEQRSGLTLEFLTQIVRHGSGAMPMFRKTEISDAELEAVAEYLASDEK